MKYLKIPLDRVGVLIGHNGEIKKDLEGKSGFKINIDSELGEIVIVDHEVDDPLMLIRIENIINSQMSDEEKCKIADYIIYNNDKTLLLPQVIGIHNKILSL